MGRKSYKDWLRNYLYLQGMDYDKMKLEDFLDLGLHNFAFSKEDIMWLKREFGVDTLVDVYLRVPVGLRKSVDIVRRRITRFLWEK